MLHPKERARQLPSRRPHPLPGRPPAPQTSAAFWVSSSEPQLPGQGNPCLALGKANAEQSPGPRLEREALPSSFLSKTHCLTFPPPARIHPLKPPNASFACCVGSKPRCLAPKAPLLTQGCPALRQPTHVDLLLVAHTTAPCTHAHLGSLLLLAPSPGCCPSFLLPPRVIPPPPGSSSPGDPYSTEGPCRTAERSFIFPYGLTLFSPDGL